MGRLHKKIRRSDLAISLIPIPPNFGLNFRDRRMRFNVDERLVANASPACFKGKMRIEFRITLVPRQIKPILNGLRRVEMMAAAQQPAALIPTLKAIKQQPVARLLTLKAPTP